MFIEIKKVAPLSAGALKIAHETGQGLDRVQAHGVIQRDAHSTPQHARINRALPRSPAMNPVVAKIPVPTILEMTSAVALKNPICRSKPGRGDRKSVV